MRVTRLVDTSKPNPQAQNSPHDMSPWSFRVTEELTTLLCALVNAEKTGTGRATLLRVILVARRLLHSNRHTPGQRFAASGHLGFLGVLPKGILGCTAQEGLLLRITWSIRLRFSATESMYLGLASLVWPSADVLKVVYRILHSSPLHCATYINVLRMQGAPAFMPELQ